MKAFASKLALNTSLFSLGLFAGRVSGYLRELVLAYQFGVSSKADYVILLLTFPDLINNLISSGVLNSLFMPKLCRVSDKKSFLGLCLAKTLLLNLVVYLVVLTYCFLNFDFSTTILLAISMLSVFPNACTSICVLFLSYKEKFAFQALGTLIFNLSIIFFLILFSLNIYISIGIVVASFVRFFAIHHKALSEGFVIDFKNVTRSNLFRDLQSVGLAIVSSGLMFINPMIDKIMANNLKPGSVAVLSYAEKLYLLPVSVVLTSVAVTSYPEMVKRLSHGKNNEFKNYLYNLNYKAFMLGLIVSLFYLLFGEFFVRLIFGVAGLESNIYSQVSRVLLGYSGAILLSGVLALCVNVLYCFEKIKLVSLVSIFSVLLNYLGDKFVISFYPNVELISTVTSLVSFITLLLLLYLIKNNFKKGQYSNGANGN